MTVDEEILYFEVSERIATLLVKKFLYLQKNKMFFKSDYSIQINDTNFIIEQYDGNVLLSVENSRVIAASLTGTYINLYTKYDWCKNNSTTKNKVLSFLNSDDETLWEHETYIDGFFENGEMCTQAQHFQFSLLHPELPEYNDMCNIHKVLMGKSSVPKGWQLNVRMMHASLNDMLDLETELLRRNK